jgi:hypothetical protein
MKKILALLLLVGFASAGQVVPIRGLVLQSDVNAGGHTITNLAPSFLESIGGVSTNEYVATNAWISGQIGLRVSTNEFLATNAWFRGQLDAKASETGAYTKVEATAFSASLSSLYYRVTDATATNAYFPAQIATKSDATGVYTRAQVYTKAEVDSLNSAQTNFGKFYSPATAAFNGGMAARRAVRFVPDIPVSVTNGSINAIRYQILFGDPNWSGNGASYRYVALKSPFNISPDLFNNNTSLWVKIAGTNFSGITRINSAFTATNTMIYTNFGTPYTWASAGDTILDVGQSCCYEDNLFITNGQFGTMQFGINIDLTTNVISDALNAKHIITASLYSSAPHQSHALIYYNNGSPMTNRSYFITDTPATTNRYYPALAVEPKSDLRDGLFLWFGFPTGSVPFNISAETNSINNIVIESFYTGSTGTISKLSWLP